MDKPANEARAFTKRDSSSDDPVASFAKDYTSGMYDGCGSAAFDAVLKAEAEARFQAIHEEEISAGVAKFTSPRFILS